MSMNSRAPLDRWVKVLGGPDDIKGQDVRISSLRSRPHVVLLGEPGSGKSDVLGIEASAAGQQAIKVAALLNGRTIPKGAPIFIDALDEYRRGDRTQAKAYALGTLLASTEASHWRLTCRAEEWRKAADQEALSDDIIVVSLLPLSSDEVQELLNFWGKVKPQEFLTSARTYGAQAFLRTPLSLRLLHAVVTQRGEWPHSRYELFSKAIHLLAHEDNVVLRFVDRTPVPIIVEAFDRTCLLMLASGAQFVWRSSALPSNTESSLMRADEIGLEPSIVNDLLGSSLFTGEGELFEYMHRAVAEFAAGRALSRAVVPNSDKAAFPFRRARALITGPDGRPPIALRGVYAWFAAHLAQLGHATGSRELIESDAASILFYGDAAAFDLSQRRLLFAKLAANDPYFRAVADREDAVLAGLIAPDFADDIIVALAACRTEVAS